MKSSSEVVKKSISLSKVVSAWADKLADSKGFGTNFSAYIADLIRRDQEREEQLKLLDPHAFKDSASSKELAEEEIVNAVRKAVRKGRPVHGKF